MDVSRGCSNLFGTCLLSRKRVKLWTSNLASTFAGPIGIKAHKNSEKMERGRIQGLPKFCGYPLLSQKRVKLRTSNFVGTFIGFIGTKADENFGNSSRGCSQGVPKIFRAPTYWAHCAIIFAIAQLSCYFRQCSIICVYVKTPAYC